MEFQEVVRRRRMVRNYDPDRAVSPQTRDLILSNALRAPSAGFSQGWAFLVLERPDERARFWRRTTDPNDVPDSWLRGMQTAPLLIVCLSHKDAYLERYARPDKGWTDRDEERWPVPYWDIDTGFAAMLMMLTVIDQDLASCFFGVPPAQIPGVLEEFGVPEGYAPVGVVSVGYAVADRRSGSLKAGRKPLADVVHMGHWGEHHVS